ncbi:MAG: hypothetical protein AAF902_12295 [Chloroflexota bacterium]
MLSAVLLLNAIWYAMGFYAFYLRREIFAKVVVPNKAYRDNSAYEAVVESGRFMGGFNLALSVLNVFLLFNVGGFNENSQWATLLIFNALAHGSQFAGNVPMALRNRRGGGIWNVFKGVMLRIFVIDFVLMVFNTLLAIWLLF